MNFNFLPPFPVPLNLRGCAKRAVGLTAHWKPVFSYLSVMSLCQLVAQAGSALCSAAGEDLAAVGGGHSLAEAVLFLALALLGLIGTKHLGLTPFNNNTQQALSCQ